MPLTETPDSLWVFFMTDLFKQVLTHLSPPPNHFPSPFFFPLQITIFINMTDISKFLSDIEKIKKHDRQNHGGNPDYERIHEDLRKLFNRSTSCPTDLPNSLFEYWENQYIFNSLDKKEEPTEENKNRLAAMLAFMENSDEFQDLLTDDDWQEMGELVGYEAEDLPVEILQDLMKILVSHGAY